jgi:hypothetical protein
MNPIQNFDSEIPQNQEESPQQNHIVVSITKSSNDQVLNEPIKIDPNIDGINSAENKEIQNPNEAIQENNIQPAQEGNNINSNIIPENEIINQENNGENVVEEKKRGRKGRK